MLGILPDIHLCIAIATVLLVLYADEQAFAWFRGKRELFHRGAMRFLHYGITAGLALLIITGGLMYYQAPAAFLSLGTFDVKMAMVFALICNTYFIERFSETAASRAYASLSRRERLPLFMSGAVSFLGWAAAFGCGLLIS